MQAWLRDVVGGEQPCEPNRRRLCREKERLTLSVQRERYVLQGVYFQVDCSRQRPAEAKISKLSPLQAIVSSGDVYGDSGQWNLEISDRQNQPARLILAYHAQHDGTGLRSTTGGRSLQLNRILAVGQQCGIECADGSGSSCIVVDRMHVAGIGRRPVLQRARSQ